MKKVAPHWMLHTQKAYRHQECIKTSQQKCATPNDAQVQIWPNWERKAKKDFNNT